MPIDLGSLRPVPALLAAHYRAEGWWTDESLGDMVAGGYARYADEPFTVHSAVRPYDGTIGDVDRAARSLAAVLQERGVGPGDVVAFQLPNWVEAGIIFAAASYLGAVLVPIVHFYGAKEVGYVLRATQPRVVVHADSFGRNDYLPFYETLMADLPDAEWLVVGDADLPERAERFDALCAGPGLAAPLQVDPDAPALIAFTSGTTSDPKGVVHSHNTIGAETRQLDLIANRSPTIIGAPVGHFIGMSNAFLLPTVRRKPVHMVDVWDAGVVLGMMTANGFCAGSGSTVFLTSLLDHPDFTPAHQALIPYVGLGGAPVPVAVTERARSLGIQVYRAYGSTEHPSITGSYATDPETKRLRTDGHPMPGVEIRLDDEGEIQSRGPDRFLGYTDPELSAAAIDDEGWYRTGDVGVVDEDGYLSITDRISDIIIRGGENISAQEVEEQLARLDAVAEVGVVAAPDERLGEHVAAVLRLQAGAQTPTLADIQAHLAQAGLAKQKWPESVYLVADFPRTASGKVQKFVLRDQVRSGTLAAVDG